MIIFSPGGGPAPYQGPLDLVPGAVVAYSQRAMAAAWVSNAITIRRDSDDATQSFATTTSNAVDAAAVSAFIGAGDGFASVWKDQSGNGKDAANATSGQQPPWSAAALGSAPGLTFTGKILNTPDVTFSASDFTVFAVISTSDLLVVNAIINGQDPGNNGPDFSLAIAAFGGTNLSFYADAFNYDSGSGGRGDAPAMSEDTYYIVEAEWGESASAASALNGASLTTSNNAYGGGASMPGTFPLIIGSTDPTTPNNTLQGIAVEIIVYNSFLSLSARHDIRQNIAAYYGITLA